MKALLRFVLSDGLYNVHPLSHIQSYLVIAPGTDLCYNAMIL